MNFTIITLYFFLVAYLISTVLSETVANLTVFFADHMAIQ